MRRILYGIAAIMVLVAGWQIRSLQETWNYLEDESVAQSYGAAPDKARVTIVAF
ncbi:MAG: hypothetical protein JWO78_2038, partial [Micavibrio sp.]|nr:hypothetical protein [Micavibrio sp.]